MAANKNIVDTALDTGRFTTLIAAIDRVGLRETLSEEGPFTVFAPSDDAFAKLPAGTVESLLAEPDTLTKVLTYHVVPGRISVEDARSMGSAPTFNGEDLPMWDGSALEFDGAHVLSPDIEASNGVIHVIDRVLIPAII